MVAISRGPREPGPGEAEPPYPAPEWQSYGATVAPLRLPSGKSNREVACLRLPLGHPESSEHIYWQKRKSCQITRTTVCLRGQHPKKKLKTLLPPPPKL